MTYSTPVRGEKTACNAPFKLLFSAEDHGTLLANCCCWIPPVTMIVPKRQTQRISYDAENCSNENRMDRHGHNRIHFPTWKRAKKATATKVQNKVLEGPARPLRNQISFRQVVETKQRYTIASEVSHKSSKNPRLCCSLTRKIRLAYKIAFQMSVLTQTLPLDRGIPCNFQLIIRNMLAVFHSLGPQ